MKKLLIATLAALSFNTFAADGYASPDASYAKVCESQAKTYALSMLKTYAKIEQADYDDVISSSVKYPEAFKNPSWPKQYLHPIEFVAALSRGTEARIRVIYANSENTSGALCTFMGIEFLDLTSAN